MGFQQKQKGRKRELMCIKCSLYASIILNTGHAISFHSQSPLLLSEMPTLKLREFGLYGQAASHILEMAQRSERPSA